MDRGAWRAIVHGVSRVGYDLVAKPHYLLMLHCGMGFQKLVNTSSRSWQMLESDSLSMSLVIY